MTKMTPTKKVRVKLLDQNGWACQDIASLFHVNPSTIPRTLRIMEEHPDPYYKKPRSGHPRKMDERDVRQATRAIVSGFVSNATDLQRKMFPHVLPTVVKDRLTEAGFPRSCLQKEAGFHRSSHSEAQIVGREAPTLGHGEMEADYILR